MTPPWPLADQISLDDATSWRTDSFFRQLLAFVLQNWDKAKALVLYLFAHMQSSSLSSGPSCVLNPYPRNRYHTAAFAFRWRAAGADLITQNPSCLEPVATTVDPSKSFSL